MVWKKVSRGFLDAIYPPLCLVCGDLSPGPYPHFCPLCFSSLEPVGPHCCERCGEPFPAGQIPHLCLPCMRGRLPFERCRGVFLYQGAVAKALSRVKYEGKISLLKPLADALLSEEYRQLNFPEVDVVVPVPMSFQGLWKRGFNQTYLLALCVAGFLRVEVATDILRKKGGRNQVGLTERERSRNAATSFFPGKGINRIEGKRVLLFDDVYTTGATVRTCSRVLRRAGSSVFVLTLARAGKTSVWHKVPE
jgi:competence protein ComFC